MNSKLYCIQYSFTFFYNLKQGDLLTMVSFFCLFYINIPIVIIVHFTANDFFHAFKQDHVMHENELNTIFNTTLIQDQLAHKYTVKLSPIPLELFYRFLHESQHKTLLRIVNQHLNINKLPPASAGEVSDQGKVKV